MIREILIFSLIVLSGFIFLVLYLKNRDHIRNLEYIKHFPEYYVVLEYYMNKAYNMIYKDRILIYSLEGMKINDTEFQRAIRDHSLLTLKLMGSQISKEFEEIFGEQESLLMNISEYFNSKMETDEIRRTTVDSFMDSELPEDSESQIKY
jgi:hypothetical protein